jgi:hypothetical protein
MNSKQTKILAIAKPAFLFVCLSLFAQGCHLGGLVDKISGHANDLTNIVTSSLDNAIGNLNANSANYQEILQKLITELPSEVQSTVTNEVSNLLNRTVAAAGAEVRCDVDFFRIRVQQALQRIKAKFLNQTLPPYEPHFCDVVPLAIDMNLPAERRPKLEFYGYDFDMAKIQVVLVDGTNEIDVSNKLDQPTHYHMTLNLGSNGVPLSTNSARIILRWNNRDISSVAVIQKAPVICETSFFQFQPDRISFMPPHTRGDKEFDGNGPNVYSNVNLINQGNQLIARVYMKAVETSSDWTTAEGTKDFVIYTADPGKRIEAVVTAGTASYSYTDNNHNMDEFPGTGPVRKFSFMGDGPGDDVGFHTRVEIDFTNIRVQLKETGDCISSTTIRLLELQNAISPALLNKVKMMRSIHFKAPNE